LKEEFSHEASLEFMANTGCLSQFKNWQQLQNVKSAGKSSVSDALTAE
jgi:hypothetical protein